MKISCEYHMVEILVDEQTAVNRQVGTCNVSAFISSEENNCIGNFINCCDHFSKMVRNQRESRKKEEPETSEKSRRR